MNEHKFLLREQNGNWGIFQRTFEFHALLYSSVFSFISMVCSLYLKCIPQQTAFALKLHLLCGSLSSGRWYALQKLTRCGVEECIRWRDDKHMLCFEFVVILTTLDRVLYIFIQLDWIREWERERVGERKRVRESAQSGSAAKKREEI